jgi:hypothetical protein
MFRIISYTMSLVFNYCTDFVINLANLTGLSYYEINTLLFIILWPLLTGMLGILLIVQKIRLSQARRSQVKHLNHQKVKGTMSFKTILPFYLMLLVSCESPSGNDDKIIWEGSKQGPDMAKLKAKAQVAKQYCQDRNLNTDFCIIIDMSMHSGLKRFFVWDFNESSITDSFLVSHGACDNPWSGDYSKEQVRFSNVNESYCSSVGMYILGERGPSQWGIRIKYLMHGQEPTNNNATRRAIVFHSWEQVSNEEVYPTGTPEGWGCPAISNEAMRYVDQRLQQADKRTLMWIVN